MNRTVGRTRGVVIPLYSAVMRSHVGNALGYIYIQALSKKQTQGSWKKFYGWPPAWLELGHSSATRPLLVHEERLRYQSLFILEKR